MKKLTLLIIFIAFQSYADNHNAVSNTQSPIIKTSTTNHPVMGLQQLQLKNQEIQFQLQLQSMKNLQDKLAEDNKYQDLRKNVLSSRESSIDLWLGVIGIFLTVLSVFFTALGVFGFFVAKNKIKEFDNLNKEAKLALREIEAHKEKAETNVKAIEELNNPKKEPSDKTLKEVKQSGTKLEKNIAEARTLELEGKTEAAIALWKEIVAIAKYEGNTDQQATGCFYLGYLYGNYDIDHKESLIFSKQAIEIKPDMHEAYSNMGNAYNELKEYQKAINACQKAIEIKPDNHEAYNNMGNAYNELKEYQKAINAYQKAIEIKHDKHKAYNNMGIAYNKLKEYQKAINAYQKAIEIKPDNHEAYNNMGVAYDELKECQKAINAYQKAIEIKHDKHEAYYNMGNAYGKLGEYQKAINAYKKAIEIKPDEHNAYYNMGNAYGELKEYQKAINAYQKAIEIEPSLINHAKKQNFDWLESYINNLDDSPVKQQNLFILNQLKGHD